MRRINHWQVGIFLLLITALGCSLSIPTTPALQTATSVPSATPVPLPPAIIETLPPIGGLISPEQLVTVFFSEKMDRASVEKAFSADAANGLVFAWVDDSTITLAPKTPFPANTKVTFSLATTAMSTGGLALPQPASFSFQTPGALKIAQTLPASGVAGISPDSAVVVSFNQPVVALGAAPATLPAGLTLEPAASGKGEWLNTSTYIFRPDPALAGGVNYTARVNPALVSTIGMALDAPQDQSSWTFSTALPEIAAISPDAKSGAINLDAVIEVTFNQPMDRASVEAGFAFKGSDGKVDGSFEWNPKSSVVKFKPSALLQRGTTYYLTIAGSSRSRGGAALGKDAGMVYQSVPDFDLLATSFPSGQQRPANLGVELTFSAPLAGYSSSDLRSLVSLTPKISDDYPSTNGSIFSVIGGFKPGETYTLTFSAGLKDRWGQQLGHEVTFTFTEPDAAPNLSLGTYLPVLFTRPEEPRISLQAVNLNSLTVTRGSMTLDDFLHVQTDYNFGLSYNPGDKQRFNITPDLPRNSSTPLVVKISNAPLAPGLYFITADSPDVQINSTNRYSLVVSNLNVTFKVSASEALLWAIDLRNQRPASRVAVKLYDSKMQNIASGVTDENGLWRGPVPAQPDGSTVYAILGQAGDADFGVSASEWWMGIAPWDFGLNFDGSGPRSQAYLYSDRPVYRPGDTVHYRGILKNWYDGRYSQSDLKDLSLTWYGPSGKIGKTQSFTPSSYGTFSGDFTLPEKAEPGFYNLAVKAGEKDVYNGWLSIQVADYRKPEINLTVSLNPDVARQGQQIVGKVKAEYFFGAAAGDLPVTWSLYSSTSDFSIPDYNTGIETLRWLNIYPGQFGSVFRSGEGRTGPDGTLEIPLDGLNAVQSSQLTLEVNATESGGFPVTARAKAILHPENFYIGVRPNAWVGRSGTALEFDLLTVDWDKHPVSQPLTAAFQKVRWDRVEGRYGDFTFTPIYTPFESKVVTSGTDGKASVTFTPPDAGTYVLDVTSGDARTQTLLWVSGSENAEWPNLPYQQIQLTTSKEKYKAGDTAEVFVPNPFNAPAQALLTTERSTFKSVDIVTIPAEGYRFNIPLTDDSAPNLYVSATLLGLDGVDFRQGYINLPVEASAFTLNVDLKATPEKARPGDTVSLDLAVSDAHGQPVQAEFSLAVVDLAALALADPNSVDIVPAYYNIQPLGVHTGLTAAVYTRRLLNFNGGRGGGGGGAEIASLRSKFSDTAYWKADIVTDAQGKAHLTLTLPDNLTTWQMDARGLTADTRVGQARLRLVTSKELLVRPQTPRFLVAGDHAELAAMLNNTTGQPLEVVASLQVDGFSLDDPAQADQKVIIPANGRVRVSWTGLVRQGKEVSPVFLVKSGDLVDAASPEDGAIPVIHYTAPKTFSTAGFLVGATSQTEIVAVPRSFMPVGGSLQVELSPSLASAILDTLKALETSEQPWSSEQIISTLLPNLVTYRVLKDSGIDNPELTARLQNDLVGDLRRLMNFRRDNGGWAWTTSSPNPDAYLTAYVLFGLQQAIDSGLNLEGVDVAQAVIAGREFLFANAGPFTWEDNIPSDQQDLTTRSDREAFYGYVLAQTGGLERFSQLPDKLFEARDRLDPWARAMLAQVIYMGSASDPRIATLLSDLESTALRSASSAHWESASGSWMNPGTPLFTTAVVVSVIAERNPASPIAADAVRYLASQRGHDRRWASTFETAWVLMALDKYMQASGDLRGDFGFSAQLNGKDFAQGKASGPENMTTISASAELSQLNLGGANSLLINKQDGAGKLYYRASLTVDRPAETAPAINDGISITREYLDCSSGTCQPVSAYQMKSDRSGLIKVKLSLTLPHDAYYLMVQDYIPAGADILDSSLKTSQQGVTSTTVTSEFDPADPYSDGWGWWYFNHPQIYSSNILWNADYLPAGSYELTYTIVPSLAGEYRVLPAHAWQAYFPEVQGTTAGTMFEIKP